MNKLTRISATVASSIALVAGFTGLAGATPSIDDTGSHSNNRITQRNTVRTDVDNHTNIDADVDVDQDADSGDVKVKHNTTVNDVSSGDAENDSWVEGSFNVENSVSSPDLSELNWESNGSISDTGSHSNNTIKTTNKVVTDVDNDTDVDVDVDVDQDAYSGNVTVEDNTTVGDVSSGDARNTSTVLFDVNVSNTVN